MYSALIHLLSHKARLITKLCLSSVMVEQSTVNNRVQCTASYLYTEYWEY